MLRKAFSQGGPLQRCGGVAAASGTRERETKIKHQEEKNNNSGLVLPLPLQAAHTKILHSVEGLKPGAQRPPHRSVHASVGTPQKKKKTGQSVSNYRCGGCTHTNTNTNTHQITEAAQTSSSSSSPRHHGSGGSPLRACVVSMRIRAHEAPLPHIHSFRVNDGKRLWCLHLRNFFLEVRSDRCRSRLHQQIRKQLGTLMVS